MYECACPLFSRRGRNLLRISFGPLGHAVTRTITRLGVLRDTRRPRQVSGCLMPPMYLQFIVRGVPSTQTQVENTHPTRHHVLGIVEIVPPARFKGVFGRHCSSSNRVVFDMLLVLWTRPRPRHQHDWAPCNTRRYGQFSGCWVVQFAVVFVSSTLDCCRLHLEIYTARSQLE